MVRLRVQTPLQSAAQMLKLALEGQGHQELSVRTHVEQLRWPTLAFRQPAAQEARIHSQCWAGEGRQARWLVRLGLCLVAGIAWSDVRWLQLLVGCSFCIGSQGRAKQGLDVVQQ
jgi:hypothetical protein